MDQAVVEDLAVRLVVWNANMAFHRKVSLMVERLRPDVAVISEGGTEAALRAGSVRCRGRRCCGLAATVIKQREAVLR